MQSQQSQVQRSLETILQDQPIDDSLSLSQRLPQASFASKSDEIKKNYGKFIQSCLNNDQLVKEMIDRGVKNDTYATAYDKNLALFSLDVLTGDLADSYKLFIKLDDQESKSIRRTKSIKNESEIEQQIEGQPGLSEDLWQQKYENFSYLLEYIRRPLQQISPVCINYFSKIMANIVTNRAEHVYTYFASQKQKIHKKNTVQEQNQIKGKKTDLQYLVEHAYNFGSVSQLLSKIMSEQGPANKYLQVKKQIVQGIIKILKNQQLIKRNSQNYQNVLEFVYFVLSRTKYRSDDKAQELSRVCQRFVDEDVIWFYKQKIIKAVTDTNNINNSSLMSSSGTITISAQNEGKPELEQQTQLKNLQILFENSLQYLKILIVRLNMEEEIDPYSSTYSAEQKQKNMQPSMDFQVNQIIFGQNSLYELLTLPIPYKYKNINKMSYYQLLLKITRNSRFKRTNTKETQNKINEEDHMGLLPSSLLPILIHLLKIFRRERRNNGLTNFYIQQIITEAILGGIPKLQNKQAMMVISALNPTEQMIRKQDTKVYCNKLFFLLDKKYPYFNQHFLKLGCDIEKIMSKYLIKLGEQSNTGYNNNPTQNTKKYIVKEFQFIQNQKLKRNQDNKPTKKIQNKPLVQKYQDDYKSQSQGQDQIKQFQPKRQFQYPNNKTQKPTNETNSFNNKINRVEKIDIKIDLQSDNIQEGLFRVSDQQIEEEIENQRKNNQGVDRQTQQKQAKEKLMELLLDSAGEQDEDQVTRDKDEQTNPKNKT